jgi:hypothetical protein
MNRGLEKVSDWCATCSLHKRKGASEQSQPSRSRIKHVKRRENKTMAEKKVKVAPKKEAKKSLKGSKKLGETKLMISHPSSH